MTRPLATLLATAGLLALSAAPALAGPLWTADFVPVKPNLLSNSELQNQLLLSDAAVHNGNGTESIVATHITVAHPFNGESDSFSHQNYSLQLTLTDSGSGESAVMTFSGDLDGTATPTSSNITNAFDVANSVHEAALGDNHYTVTIGPYVANGQGANVGTISVTIAVAVPDDVPTEPQPNDAPEPTTLLLAGMGAALSGLRWLRQRST